MRVMASVFRILRLPVRDASHYGYTIVYLGREIAFCRLKESLKQPS